MHALSQILFGLMQAHPADLGYEPMAVPGYAIEELLGRGAYSVVLRARRTAVANSATTLRVPAVCLPAPWTEHAVSGEGNCLLHAIAHQLQINTVLDEHGELYTYELLRTLVLRRVDQDSRFRLIMSDIDELDLSRLTGYVAHSAIAALAASLGVPIVLFGVPGGGHVSFNVNGELGLTTAERPTLRIVYDSHYHYYSSVVPEITSTAVVLSAPRRLRSHSQQRTASVSSEVLLPAAIKIFEDRHRHMRDHEYTILDTLKLNSNVPSLIQALDVVNRPALILSPVCSTVLPLQDGVRANKTDFVKLLQVLRDAHMLGICHRDVKPHNIFKDAHSGCIMLSDWSSAAKTGSWVRWAGTSFFYKKHMDFHSPQPVDDLVALIRTIHLMYTNCMPLGRETVRQMEGSVRWRGALQLAEACDYDGLRDFCNAL